MTEYEKRKHDLVEAIRIPDCIEEISVVLKDKSAFFLYPGEWLVMDTGVGGEWFKMTDAEFQKTYQPKRAYIPLAPDIHILPPFSPYRSPYRKWIGDSNGVDPYGWRSSVTLCERKVDDVK